MEPRIILIKPAYLPVLPTYDALLRSTRAMTRFMFVYPALIALCFIYLNLGPIITGIGVVGPFVAAVLIVRRFTKLSERLVGVTTGELPSISAFEVDGGFALRPGHSQGPRGGLVVHEGDTVSVTVERATDPRKPGRRLGWVIWTFASGDAAPVIVGTYYDADRALLRDVESRLKALGVSVEMSHTPFDETPDE